MKRLHSLHVWFCRVVLSRTPKQWVDFGGGDKRWGYWELNELGQRTVFISHGQMYI
jgi:hypothetical protein